MALGVQLRDLIRGVRAETGKSLNVAHGVAERDSIVYQIQTKQEWLYYNFDWASLDMKTTLQTVAGTDIYNFPAALAFDFINEVTCSDDGLSGFCPVKYGIGPGEYNCTSKGTQGWPVQAWQVDSTNAPNTQFNVWPVPSKVGTLMFQGRRALMPLVNDADPSTLDGTLIVLFVAADILARNKAEDAAKKLADARQHMRNITRRQGANKRAPFILGGGMGAGAYQGLRRGIDYIAPG
jgi:hypothetical protein